MIQFDKSSWTRLRPLPTYAYKSSLKRILFDLPSTFRDEDGVSEKWHNLTGVFRSAGTEGNLGRPFRFIEVKVSMETPAWTLKKRDPPFSPLVQMMKSSYSWPCQGCLQISGSQIQIILGKFEEKRLRCVAPSP